MRALIQRIFVRYGTDATIDDGDTVTEAKVFFQSVNSKSWQNMETVFHPLGRVQGGQYVCFLPAGTAVKAGDMLTVAGKRYGVCRVEDMPGGLRPAYRWAICTGKGREG